MSNTGNSLSHRPTFDRATSRPHDRAEVEVVEVNRTAHRAKSAVPASRVADSFTTFTAVLPEHEYQCRLKKDRLYASPAADADDSRGTYLHAVLDG